MSTFFLLWYNVKDNLRLFLLSHIKKDFSKEKQQTHHCLKIIKKNPKLFFIPVDKP